MTTNPPRQEHPMTHREQTIEQILERLTELIDPMQSGNGNGDSGLRLMPATYTKSVREVEALLGKLHDQRHHIWWHVTERYIRAQQTTAYKCPKCNGISHYATHSHRDKHGKPSTYKGKRILRTTWNERVNPKKVEQGIQQIAAWWTLTREPEMPSLNVDKSDDKATRVAA
jgi:hypothetical protein